MYMYDLNHPSLLARAVRALSLALSKMVSFAGRTERRTEASRRTVHVRYRQPEPAFSRHGIIDPHRSVAHFTAALPDRAAVRPPHAAAGKL